MRVTYNRARISHRHGKRSNVVVPLTAIHRSKVEACRALGDDKVLPNARARSSKAVTDKERPLKFRSEAGEIDPCDRKIQSRRSRVEIWLIRPQKHADQ